MPVALTTMEGAIPISMVPGTSWLVTYVMPFPLSLWGVSTTLTYSFPSRTVVFTDANPSCIMNYTFPIAITSYFSMCPGFSGGDSTHYTNSWTCPAVWKRTASNIFALAAFGSWLSIAPSVGTWQSDYPYSLTLTAGTTVDWLVTGQTGSTDLFSRYVQSRDGFTIAARWSTSTNTSCAVDIVDTYETLTVRDGHTDRRQQQHSQRLQQALTVDLSLAGSVCMWSRAWFSLNAIISIYTAVQITRAFACA